jgi:alpha-ketoglutarate-dependent taurine dioxygenase
MTDLRSITSEPLSIGERRRKVMRVSSENLVQMETLPGLGSLPLVIRPAISQMKLVEWVKNNVDLIESQLLVHGAILFREFGIHEVAMFEAFAAATSIGGLLDYKYGSTPRSRISGGIYTSTEYPADQIIPFHNEMSYSRAWPMKIWFCCLKSTPEGGATPIANSARVFEGINAEIRARFIEHGVMYVRNYGSGLDLSCEQVFGTADRNEIENFCRDAGIECEWEGSRLTTRQKCQAVAAHPKTGKTVWFNQAHLFHISSLDQAVASELLAELGEQNLPRNAYYGDGATIEPEALAEIRNAYQREAIRFDWEEGDVLMVDNMQVAHGREAYMGERRIAVAMAEQYFSNAF